MSWKRRHFASVLSFYCERKTSSMEDLLIYFVRTMCYLERGVVIIELVGGVALHVIPCMVHYGDEELSLRRCIAEK